MPGLGSAPHHLVGAGHLAAPPFRGGAGVEMILQCLAQHVAAGTGDEFLHGVFRALGHLRITQPGDQSIE
jgi:hypothetical protein